MDNLTMNEKLYAAQQELSRICQTRDWRSTIPVKPDNSDVIIGDALTIGQYLVAENANIQEKLMLIFAALSAVSMRCPLLSHEQWALDSTTAWMERKAREALYDGS